MKARIMMLIMAAALVALPTMAQQEWQSTSAMQGSGSAYGAQVTAVGAAGVTDMATTTTDTYSPAQAPTGRRKTLIGGGEYGQSDQSPIGDAWPLVLFAALFAIVITIKKHKQTIMKKNIKTFLFIAALLMSNSMWGYDLPDGTYIFDLKTNFTTLRCTQIELFGNRAYPAHLSNFNTSQDCNVGITAQAKNNVYVESGQLEYVFFTLESTITNAAGGFYHIRVPRNSPEWIPRSWTQFDKPISPVTGHSDVFLCRINEDGSYEWITDASQLPNCSGLAGKPNLQFQAADAHGSITTHTANGEEVDSGPVTSGSTIVLTATPAEHFRFRDWTNSSGEVVHTEATYTFTITESVNLTANFISDTDPSISGCAGCFKVAP